MWQGVLFSLTANLLFGSGYYFAVLLRPLAGMDMFGFRIVVLMPFILLAVMLFRQHQDFTALLQKLRQTPPLVGVLLLLALNTGVQLWLFLWAPNNGQALPVSIGYLLLPIVSATLGKLVFREQFTPLKWAALWLAVLGVLVNMLISGSLSWATVLAAVGYPLYTTLRRYYGINTLATFWVELALCLPIASYFLAQVDLHSAVSENPPLYVYLILFGFINGLAFILHIMASNLLPLNLLGLLGYVEPLVMLFIAFLIGETLAPSAYFLMICLTSSLFLLSLDSFRKRR